MVAAERDEIGYAHHDFQMGVRSSGIPDCHVAHSAELSARRHLWARSRKDFQRQVIYIATVRKDGNQSNAASVWFTMSADNKANLIQTGPQTWKAKRIKRGSPVWYGSVPLTGLPSSVE